MNKDFKCPVCGSPLSTSQGTQLDPTNGYTVWCPNRTCTAQEVAGHGSTVNKAFEVVVEKFSGLVEVNS